MANFEKFTLTPAEISFIDKEVAEGAESSNHDFFASIKSSYEQYGSVTKKMKEAIKRNMDEEKNRPKIGGVPVGNRVLLDKKPVCREQSCKEFATVVVGNFGYCAPHATARNEAMAAAAAATAPEAAAK